MLSPRRRFLQSAAGLAAGLAVAPPRGNATEQVPGNARLPKVRLGNYEISRLIIGENPFYGYSHFNRLLDELMREWSTQERVCQVLHRCEQNGVNTWEFTHSQRSLSDWKRHQAEGGKLQFILLSSGEMQNSPNLIPELAKLKPIGMVHHGGVTDRLFRAGQADKVREFLKRVRQSGVMVGLSTHNPEVLERVEEQNWDVDFYMTCLYRLTRAPEEIRKITGELPLPAGEVYLEGDPARMCRAVRQTRKTCLAFKILAAGRQTGSPESIDQAFRFAFENIKPQDCVIVGMYPRYTDQVKENADRARRIFGAAT